MKAFSAAKYPDGSVVQQTGGWWGKLQQMVIGGVHDVGPEEERGVNATAAAGRQARSAATISSAPMPGQRQLPAQRRWFCLALRVIDEVLLLEVDGHHLRVQRLLHAVLAPNVDAEEAATVGVGKARGQGVLCFFIDGGNGPGYSAWRAILPPVSPRPSASPPHLTGYPVNPMAVLAERREAPRSIQLIVGSAMPILTYCKPGQAGRQAGGQGQSQQVQAVQPVDWIKCVMAACLSLGMHA